MAPKLTWDRRAFGAFLRSRDVERGCVFLAQPEAARIAAGTPVDSGDTRGSTHVEPYDFGDRRGAVIVQEGAAVQLNWGNARTRAIHHAERGR